MKKNQFNPTHLLLSADLQNSELVEFVRTSDVPGYSLVKTSDGGEMLANSEKLVPFTRPNMEQVAGQLKAKAERFNDKATYLQNVIAACF